MNFPKLKRYCIILYTCFSTLQKKVQFQSIQSIQLVYQQQSRSKLILWWSLKAT